MLKNKIVLVVLPLLFLLPSCITSLHPLVTSDKVVTDNRIIGTWQTEGKGPVTIEEVLKSKFFKESTRATVDKNETSMGFDNRDDSLLYSRSYVFNFTKSGYTYSMLASLMRINNETYADLFPVSVEIVKPGKSTGPDDLFNSGSYYPFHTIAKINIHTNSIDIKFLNGDFIKTQLAAGRMAIRYEQDDLFNTSCITASTKDLQQLLLKYGKNEQIYNSQNTISLSKVQP